MVDWPRVGIRENTSGVILEVRIHIYGRGNGTMFIHGVFDVRYAGDIVGLVGKTNIVPIVHGMIFGATGVAGADVAYIGIATFQRNAVVHVGKAPPSTTAAITHGVAVQEPFLG
jgi:hypothetical protein